LITKRNINSFVSLSISELISSFIFFIIVIYLARVLGAEGLGKITFAKSVVIYLLMVVNAGLDLYAVRTASRNNRLIKTLISNIISLRLFLAFIIYGVLIIFVFLLPRDYETKQILLYYGGMLFTTAFLLDWPFQAVEKMGYSAFGRLIGEVAFLIMIAAVVHGPGQILWVPLSRVFGSILQLLFLLVLCWKFFGRIKLKFKLSTWKNMLAISLPMGAGFIMVQIYYNIDSVMLGLMKTDKEVGLYAAAYKLLMAIALFGSAFQRAIYPSLSRLSKVSKLKMDQLLGESLKFSLIVTLPIVLTGIVISSELIHFLYRSGFEESALVFQILVVNVILMWINGLIANSVLASDKEKKYLIGVTMGAVSNFGLNLVFIPQWGMIGAAVTTVFSEVVVFIYFYLTFLIKIETKLISRLSYIFLSIFISGAFTFLLKNLISPKYLLLFIFYFIYFTMLIISKVIDLKHMVSFIRSLVKH